MKILKLIALSAIMIMVTVGASNGAPTSMLTAVPGEPGVTSPTNGEVLALGSTPGIGINFTWNDTAGTVPHTASSGTYDIEISTDATFTNAAAIVDSSDHKHTAADSCSRSQPNFASTFVYLPATIYYWRIQAYDTTCR